MRNAEFNDPRLVEVYDAEYLWSQDDEFFLAVVDERPASQVVDLGCGTGRLAIGMARAGHHVTGVDPAAASLERAKTKPGSEGVTWIQGGSSALTSSAFHTAVMTSHVAQFIIDDSDWARALSDLHRALVPGGRLVFDSRDPQDEAWRSWNQTASRRTIELDGGEVVTTWSDAISAVNGLVDAVRHYRFPDGIELLSEMTLRFRSEPELRASLEHAGFQIEHVFGGWRREPVGDGDGELLFIARKPHVSEESGASHRLGQRRPLGRTSRTLDDSP